MLENVWSKFSEFWDFWATLAIVVIVTLVDAIQGGISSDTGVTIALALLATVLLKVLVNSNQLSDELSSFNTQIVDNHQELLEQQKRPDGMILKRPKDGLFFASFDKDCQMARDLWIVGGSLQIIVPEYKSKFEEMAKEGCKLHFILLDPESAAVKQVGNWANRRTFKHAIENSLKDLAEIKKDNPDNVKIRLNNAIPAISFIGINLENGTNRKLRLDLNIYQCSSRNRLYFELFPDQFAQHADWFETFEEQIKNLWSKATPY